MSCYKTINFSFVTKLYSFPFPASFQSFDIIFPSCTCVHAYFKFVVHIVAIGIFYTEIDSFQYLPYIRKGLVQVQNRHPMDHIVINAPELNRCSRISTTARPKTIHLIRRLPPSTSKRTYLSRDQIIDEYNDLLKQNHIIGRHLNYKRREVKALRCHLSYIRRCTEPLSRDMIKGWPLSDCIVRKRNEV